MPQYELKAPNGKTYTIEGPEGATVEQVRAEILRRDPSAGRAAAPRPAQRPSIGNALMEAANTTAARVTEGMAGPLEMLSTPGRLVNRGLNRMIGGAGDAVLRGLGMNGPANSLMKATQSADRGLANSRPVTTVTERNSPLDQRTGGAMGDFVGQMAGGMLLPVPGGPKARPRIPTAPARATAAQQVVREGQRQGVRVMTSDVRPPRTFVGKSVQSLGERVPILGTGGGRAAQQTERVEAVRNLAREYGAATGDDLTAPALTDVMDDFARTRGAEVSNFARTKTAIIEGLQGPVAVPNTTRALDAQIAKFSKVDTPAARTLVSKLEGWKQALLVPGRTEATGLLDASANPIVRTIAPQGKGLSTIDLIRAEMGQAFKDPSLASIKDAGEKAMQSIYGPMKSDMGAFIKTVGGPDKLAQWNKSNAMLSGMADELSVTTLRGVLRSGKGTPEDVAKILFSNKPSLVRRLYNNTSSEGRMKAQAAILQRAIEKSGGMEATSPEKFVTQVGALGKSIGVFFPEQDMARIDGLTRLLKSTARAGQAGVMTNSGQQAVPFLVGGAAVSHPWLVGGGALLARAYESAPVRNALLKLGRAPAGSKAEGIMMERAAVALSSQISKLTEGWAVVGLNDNVGVSAAAGDGQEYQDEQQPPLAP